MSCALAKPPVGNRSEQQKGLLKIYAITAAGGCYKNELMKVSKL
jgi:hypothetical protein